MKEDETIFNCSNLDNHGYWQVYSTQRKMVTKLLRCPSFKKTEDITFKGKVIGVRGLLPYKSITVNKRYYTLDKSELKTDSEGVPND